MAEFICSAERHATVVVSVWYILYPPKLVYVYCVKDCIDMLYAVFHLTVFEFVAESVSGANLAAETAQKG
jgi:hypothetical protein